MPAGMNTDAFTKYLRRRADTEYTHPRGPGEPLVPELLREAAHRLDRLDRALRDAATVIERMANGASRPECSPELDHVIAALDILAAGCGGPPDGQLTLAAGQVPQPGPAAAPKLRKRGPHGWWYE